MNKPVYVPEQGSRMRLSSPAFGPFELMPREHTREGAGSSPALNWENLPLGVQSLALVMMDCDIPSPQRRLGQFIHWVVYNIPVEARGLPANFDQAAGARLGACTAKNGSGRRGYYPPCPVMGQHEYIFRLYALDAAQLDTAVENYRNLMKAMAGHILDSTELVGTYRCTILTPWQAMLKNLLPD